MEKKTKLEKPKLVDLRDVFGTLKTKKGKRRISGQEFKDMVKEGWS